MWTHPTLPSKSVAAICHSPILKGWVVVTKEEGNPLANELESF